MPTYRLECEYEGTRYHSWQEQQNARSVSGELKRAIADAGGDVVELGGAGRTDAGVHGFAMRAHADIAKDIAPFILMEALNAHLKPDPVAILACEVVGPLIIPPAFFDLYP